MQQLILGISYAIYSMMDPYGAYDGIILHGCLTSAVPLRSQKLQVIDDMKKDWFQIEYQKNSFFFNRLLYFILFYAPAVSTKFTCGLYHKTFLRP